MIKVSYGVFKQDVIYDADEFKFVEGNPFIKSGLYIKKEGKTVAFINNVEGVQKVEHLVNDEQHIAFSLCGIMNDCRGNDDVSAEEIVRLVDEELKEYYGAKLTGVLEDRK